MKYKRLKQLIKEDFRIRFQKDINKCLFLKSILFDINFRVVVIIRFQHYFFEIGGIRGKLLATFLRNFTIKNYGVEIGNKAQIKGGLNIHHINGLVIGEHVLIGKNFNVFQNVTLGSLKGKYPVIGDNVTIYPGAIVIGDIVIGSNSKIGPNVVVKKSIEENTILYVDNRFYQEVIKNEFI